MLAAVGGVRLACCPRRSATYSATLLVADLYGDRVSVAFNTVFRCPGHEQKGAYFAIRTLEFRGAVGKLVLRASAAVSSGPAIVGNVGCASLKKFSVLGSVSSDVRSLLDVACAWNVGALCTLDVSEVCSGTVHVRHIVPAVLGGQLTLLSELMAQISFEVAEEWMYQIAQGEASNPHSVNNSVIFHLYTGDVEGASKSIDDCSCPVARALYESCIANSNTVQPVVIGAPLLPASVQPRLPVAVPSSTGSVAAAPDPLSPDQTPATVPPAPSA